jgi:hypothetical protein
MLRDHKLCQLVAVTFLCLSADAIATPIDETNVASHRTRATRSARTECDHESIPADSDHGLGHTSFIPITELIAHPSTWCTAVLFTAEHHLTVPAPQLAGQLLMARADRKSAGGSRVPARGRAPPSV